ncbi:hypothetical protein TNCV_1409391 [Trichonephila clavipes]|uniref:Uncharacterized protein n=1 Tax=Trichonephila clavipes TaxID=2585209 RepID=A0A8X6RBT4_TRICX|nr:hypothetical protein TNCV_1409391 [Trichonephila clavipes]
MWNIQTACTTCFNSSVKLVVHERSLTTPTRSLHIHHQKIVSQKILPSERTAYIPTYTSTTTETSISSADKVQTNRFPGVVGIRILTGTSPHSTPRAVRELGDEGVTPTFPLANEVAALGGFGSSPYLADSDDDAVGWTGGGCSTVEVRTE